MKMSYDYLYSRTVGRKEAFSKDEDAAVIVSTEPLHEA